MSRALEHHSFEPGMRSTYLTGSLWMGDAVSIAQGEDLLVGYDTGTTMRHWCSNCGSGMINHKPDGMVVVYAAVLVGTGYVHPSMSTYLTEWCSTDKTVAEPSQTGMLLQEAQ